MQVLSDKTLVAYVNKQGGTKSQGLQKVVASIFSWTEPTLLSLSAVHLKGTLNLVASFLSRWPVFQNEWALDQDVFREFVVRWGSPDVDLFDTRSNVKVCFCSLAKGDHPWALDVLTVRWVFPLGYAFRPLRLISAVLWKLGQERMDLMLVIPFWPRRSRFALMRTLAGDPPWLLPRRPNLLYHGPVQHPNLQMLSLSVCFLRKRS